MLSEPSTISLLSAGRTARSFTPYDSKMIPGDVHKAPLAHAQGSVRVPMLHILPDASRLCHATAGWAPRSRSGFRKTNRCSAFCRMLRYLAHLFGGRLSHLLEDVDEALGESIGVLRNELVEAAGELLGCFERRHREFGADFVFEQVSF